MLVAGQGKYYWSSVTDLVLKFCLRQVTDDDHQFLLDLHNDPDVLKNITDPTPITFESHMRWWNSRGDNEEYMIFCVNDERVGFTKFRPIDRINRNVVLGADIHKDHRGKGYAKYMWDLMLRHAFNDLGVHRASLLTATYNKRGYSVYSRLGFVEEGKHIQMLQRDGTFHDVICMYLLSHNWPSYQCDSWVI